MLSFQQACTSKMKFTPNQINGRMQNCQVSEMMIAFNAYFFGLDFRRSCCAKIIFFSKYYTVRFIQYRTQPEQWHKVYRTPAKNITQINDKSNGVKILIVYVFVLKIKHFEMPHSFSCYPHLIHLFKSLRAFFTFWILISLFVWFSTF